MAFVYFLYFEKTKKYYIGSTKNIGRRLQQHANHLTTSTRNSGVPKLVFSQKYDTVSQARKVENWLKRLKRRDYLEKMIRDNITKKELPG